MVASDKENGPVAVLGLYSLSWWVSDTDLTTAAKDGSLRSVEIGAEPRSGKSTGRALLRFIDAGERDAYMALITDKFGGDVRSEVLDDVRAAQFLNPPPPPPPVTAATGFRPPPGFPPPPGMFPPGMPPPGMFPPGIPPPPQLLQMMFRTNANGKPPIGPPPLAVPQTTVNKPEEKESSGTGNVNSVVSKPPDVKSDRPESSRRERSPRRDSDYRRSSRRRSRSRTPDRRRRSRSPGYSRRRRSPSPKRRRDDDYERGYRRSRRRTRSRSPRRRDRSPIRGRGRTPPRGERRGERGRTPPRGERRRTPPRGERRRTPPRGERRRTPPRGEKNITSPRADRRISPPRGDQSRGNRERSLERRRGSRERSNSKGRGSRDRSRERGASPVRGGPNHDKPLTSGRSPNRIEKDRGGENGIRPGFPDRLNMPLSEMEKEDINDNGGRSRRRRGGRKSKRSGSGSAMNGSYSMEDPARKRAKLGGRR